MITLTKAIVEDPASRIDALIAIAEPKFVEWFRDALTAMLAAVGTLEEIEALIASGAAEGVIVAAAERAALRASGIWADAYVASGNSAAQFVSNQLRVVVDFDRINQRAINALQMKRFDLIREFAAEQRAVVQEALLQGTLRGLNPRAQARLFRDSIGLTQSQTRAVGNFRQLLEANSAEALTRQLRDKRFDPTIRAAIASEEPLTVAQVDRMVDRYRDRFISLRAETIARTEALDAVHQGSEELYQQAIDSGDLLADDLVRIWHVRQDGRQRDAHNAMQGQRRPLFEPFRSGAGNQLRRPGDPNAPASERINCRCRISTRFLVP